MMRSFLLIILFFLYLQLIKSQSISLDSANQLVFGLPVFSTFKDNYAVVGSPFGKSIDKNTVNVKFQFSCRIRLHKSVLPFNTFAFFHYTQKSIFLPFAFSSPISETNFNPSGTIGKIISVNDQFKGIAALGFEHESNGRSDSLSRAWNKIVAHYNWYFSNGNAFAIRAWLPFHVERKNGDITHFIGFGEAEYHYNSPRKTFFVDIIGRKGWSPDWRGSLETQVSYLALPKFNMYFSAQFFTGFCETLVNFNRPVQVLRVGLMVR